MGCPHKRAWRLFHLRNHRWCHYRGHKIASRQPQRQDQPPTAILDHHGIGVESSSNDRGCEAGAVGVQVGGNVFGVDVAVGNTNVGGNVGGRSGFSAEFGLEKIVSNINATITVANNTTTVKTLNNVSRFIFISFAKNFFQLSIQKDVKLSRKFSLQSSNMV
jgi:hypothetical protein